MAAPEPELELAWQRHLGDDRRLLDGLLSRHREKQRRYHTATHVALVIHHIEELAAVNLSIIWTRWSPRRSTTTPCTSPLIPPTSERVPVSRDET